MSDVMLFGVLRMPYDMAMATETSRHQYWQRGKEAADRIDKLEIYLAEAQRCLDVKDYEGAIIMCRAALGEKKDGN